MGGREGRSLVSFRGEGVRSTRDQGRRRRRRQRRRLGCLALPCLCPLPCPTPTPGTVTEPNRALSPWSGRGRGCRPRPSGEVDPTDRERTRSEPSVARPGRRGPRATRRASTWGGFGSRSQSRFDRRAKTSKQAAQWMGRGAASTFGNVNRRRRARGPLSFGRSAGLPHTPFSKDL